jgi:hypothetical protein
MNDILNSAAYAALRHAGAPPRRARLQLALTDRTAQELERAFQIRKWAGPRLQRPAFARHDAHVRAVWAQGGFPAITERRR